MLTVCLSSLNVSFSTEKHLCYMDVSGLQFQQKFFFECKDADNLWGFLVYSPLVCTVIFLFETVDKSVHDPH